MSGYVRGKYSVIINKQIDDGGGGGGGWGDGGGGGSDGGGGGGDGGGAKVGSAKYAPSVGTQMCVLSAERWRCLGGGEIFDCWWRLWLARGLVPWH